jgi:integrase
MAIVDFEPSDAYRYRDKRGKEAPTSTNRELEVLSVVFSKCFEWGVSGLKIHPMIEGKFKKLSIPARTRVVEDWEKDEALGLKPPKFGRSAIPMCQAYLRVKLVSGRRRIEILNLKTTDLLEEGVRWTLAKQKQTRITQLITEWTPELRAAIDSALRARPIGKKASKPKYRDPANISPWVFCKWDGTPYLNKNGTESEAFGSAWGRFMDALIERTNIKERFWDSDLRAKAAGDADSVEHAQKLLGHTNKGTTMKHYRRKPETVKPVR